MANVYVRSGAAGAGTGADWANAYTTQAAAATAKAAGDVFFVSEDHAETQASAMTITFPGTVSNPNFVYCVNHLGTVPPVSADLRTTASISTTGNNNILINGCVYGYGIIFQLGSGAVAPNLSLAQTATNTQEWEACAFNNVATGSASLSIGGATGGGKVTFKNTTILPNATGFATTIACDFVWRDTANAIAGATFPNTLFTPSNARPSSMFVEGVDLSALGSGKTLVGASGAACNPYIFKDCKLGASVTICATPAALSNPAVIIIRSDNGATNYRTEKYTYAGTQTMETTIVRAGGASDGTLAHAWKIITTANAKWKFPFECIAMTVWNDTVGSPVTATVEGVWGGGAVPLNDEIWAEVEYPGSSSFPTGSLGTSSKADGLATGANCTSSAASWGGSTTAFKMAVTFTPQMKGWVTVYVKVGKASSTFYVDPDPVLS